MWFIPFYSTYGLSFGPLGIGYRAVSFFDSAWVEYFGGQVLQWVLFHLGRANDCFQYNTREGVSRFSCYVDCYY
jgi:hypothetical protein